MEAAALLRLAALRGVAAACLLAVTDVPRDGEMQRIGPGGAGGARRRASGEVGPARRSASRR